MQFFWSHINQEATWNICTYKIICHRTISVSLSLCFSSSEAEPALACSQLEPGCSVNIFILAVEVWERAGEGQRERERVMTRAELWTLTTFPSGPISLREKKSVAASQCKAARDGGNERQKDRHGERWTGRGTQHLFLLRRPQCGRVAFCNPAWAVRHCGRSCPLLSDHKFSLLFLYYINSDNVSKEVCVCESSHSNLIEGSLWGYLLF